MGIEEKIEALGSKTTVPVKKSGWINISGPFRRCGYMYDTEEQATVAAKREKDVIATVKVEWTE